MSGAHRGDRVRGPRRRPLPVLVLAGALLLGATGGLGTLAYWNDVETVSGGTVRAGSLDLRVQDSDGVEVGTWQRLVLADMAPGESVAASLTIKNVGTTPFTVEVAASGGGLLLPGVDVALASGVAPSAASSTYPRQQTCGAAADRPLSQGPTWAVDGSIVPGASRQLCVRLALRVGASDELQGKAVTPTFVVTATQVRP